MTRPGAHPWGPEPSHAGTEKLQAAKPGDLTLTLNNQPFAVVGVLPDGFHGAGGLYTPDVIVPLERRAPLGLGADRDAAANEWLTLVGRVRPAVSFEQAAAELTAILGQIEEAPAGLPQNIRARFAPMIDGHPEERALSVVAAIGMAAVGVVLLIACFNVTGLLVARASERRREMAVRSALGASPARLARQLVTEGLVLAGLAGTLALALSMASGNLLSAFSLPAPIPQQLDVSPDARSVAFTLLLILFAGLLPSFLPARHAVRLDLQPILGSESGTATGAAARTRARRVFQVCQIAGSTMFLALAVLFAGSFRHMRVTDAGFDMRDVLVVTVDPRTHACEPHRAETFFRQLAERLQHDNRVRGAAATAGIPYSISAFRGTTLGLSGQDCGAGECQAAEMFVVEPGYLKAMQIALVSGRDLTDADKLAGGGIVLGASTARKLWPDQSPLGQTVIVGTTGEIAQVVGIAADVASSGLGRAAKPQAYRAMRTADYDADGIVFVAGVKGDPAELAESVRSAASELDPHLPIRSVKAMSEHLSLPLWAPRVAAWFLGICGAVALLLATIGLFGVVSYAVSQRTREFGIRMALGASAGKILRLVLSEGFVLTAIGGVVGLLAARLAGALVGAALVGVSSGDPLPYVVAAALQMTIAIVGCGYPARRAARVDLIGVMRSEH